MPATPPPERGQQGPGNELHLAAFHGSVKRVVAILATGSTDIDQSDPSGRTPLMFAAGNDNADVIRILLNKGANMSAATEKGWTALHVSSLTGQLSATLLLVKAGADLDAVDNTGATPLNMATCNGHSEVMTALIEAGANIDSRMFNGSTPLYNAALGGQIDPVRVLLRAKANPLLTKTIPSEQHQVPLDIAALHGHSEIVRDLIQQVGIERCGGETAGAYALQLATQEQNVGIMSILVDGGVVDTGLALITAVQNGYEGSAKFLLQQHEKGNTAGGANYVGTTHGAVGVTPLFCGIAISCSHRLVRLLIDAGADTAMAIRVIGQGECSANRLLAETPLDLATHYLGEKNVSGKPATGAQLIRLEAIRRLLLQVEAAHAVSWLWMRDVPLIGEIMAQDPQATKLTSNSMTLMLRRMRRGARARGVVLAPLFRHSSKPGPDPGN